MTNGYVLMFDVMQDETTYVQCNRMQMLLETTDVKCNRMQMLLETTDLC